MTLFLPGYRDDILGHKLAGIYPVTLWACLSLIISLNDTFPLHITMPDKSHPDLIFARIAGQITYTHDTGLSRLPPW